MVTAKNKNPKKKNSNPNNYGGNGGGGDDGDDGGDDDEDNEDDDNDEDESEYNDPDDPNYIERAGDKYFPGRSRTTRPIPIRTRSPLDSKVEWKGHLNKFSEYMNQVEAWTHQTQQGYLTDFLFMEAYLDNGWKSAKKYAPDITQSQFRMDKRGLFGAIQGSTRNSNRGRNYVSDHWKDKDGVKVWYKFLQDFNQGSNIAAKVDDIRATLDTPYHEKYPGGVSAYIDSIVTAYSRLEMEDPNREHNALEPDRQ